MSKVKPGQQNASEFRINLRTAGDGTAVIGYVPSHDFVLPDGHPERLEWIRQSYERFLQKVLEKEELVGMPPTDIS